MTTPTSNFFFAVSQLGMEHVLKDEFTLSAPQLRPAFSRPGFVTWKSDAPISLSDPVVESCFARAQGISLGKVKGEDMSKLAKQVWALETVQAFAKDKPFADIHVWQRDWAMPGWRGYAPGPTHMSFEAETALRKVSPFENLQREPNTTPTPSSVDAAVLDVVLVEPNEWWIGCHVANRWISRWAGGVIPIDVPQNAISRAYGKMAEAINWSKLPLTEGETVLEIGCAPGGASQALLDIGMKVIGVDPAEVHDSLLERKDFTYLRKRSAEVRKNQIKGVRWLVSDMVVAPKYTLDAAEDHVMHSDLHIRGMVLTIKLPEINLTKQIPAYIKRIKSWGFADVRARQLALGGKEICVVALRSRSQRRIHRPV